jgi:hypothetical protein
MLAEVKDERCQGHAHDVVDQERREDARERYSDRQQDPRLGKVGGDPRRGPRKESSQSEIGYYHHHAKEQDNRLVIDGLGSLAHREDTGGDHGRGADQSDSGPVNPQPGHLAQGQGQVGQAEDRRNQVRGHRRRRHGR